MTMNILLLQSELVGDAVRRAFEYNVLAGFLTLAIVTLGGAVIVLYRAKEKQAERHASELKSLLTESISSYADINSVLSSIAAGTSDRDERLMERLEEARRVIVERIDYLKDHINRK